jgi:hypothetical protein
VRGFATKIEAAQFTLTQRSDGMWMVIDLPNDYREGQPLPPPRVGDRHFETKADAEVELLRRMDMVARPVSRINE